MNRRSAKYLVWLADWVEEIEGDRAFPCEQSEDLLELSSEPHYVVDASWPPHAPEVEPTGRPRGYYQRKKRSKLQHVAEPAPALASPAPPPSPGAPSALPAPPAPSLAPGTLIVARPPILPVVVPTVPPTVLVPPAPIVPAKNQREWLSERIRRHFESQKLKAPSAFADVPKPQPPKLDPYEMQLLAQKVLRNAAEKRPKKNLADWEELPLAF